MKLLQSKWHLILIGSVCVATLMPVNLKGTKERKSKSYHTPMGVQTAMTSGNVPQEDS